MTNVVQPRSRHAIPSPHNTGAAFVSWGGLLACFFGAFFFFALNPPHVGAVLFSAGVLVMRLSMVVHRPCVVELDGDVVRNVPGIGDLPVGVGSIEIFVRERRTHDSKGKERIEHHTEVVHQPSQAVLHKHMIIDVAFARMYAEALGRIARIPVKWFDRERYVEVVLAPLPPGAMLAERVRRIAEEPAPTEAPDGTFVRCTTSDRDDFVVTLKTRARPMMPMATFAAAAGAALFAVGLLDAGDLRAHAQALTVALFSVFFSFAPRLFASATLVAEPAGITLVRRFLGVAYQRVRMEAADIDGIYTSRSDVVIAGRDGNLVWFDVGELPACADWARSQIARAWSRTLPPASDGHARKCPRCRTDTLGAGANVGDATGAAGALDDHGCSKCHGRFLSPAGAERLLEGELGVTKEALRGLVRAIQGARDRVVCPSCGHRMSLARVNGVECDVCTGCGGLWLDAGELHALTHGARRG